MEFEAQLRHGDDALQRCQTAFYRHLRITQRFHRHGVLSLEYFALWQKLNPSDSPS